MLIVTDHTGLSSSSMTELRGLLQRGGARYMVVKNRLLKRALGEERAAPLAGALEGPTALAVTAGDSAAFSKIIVEFAKKNQGPRVKAGFLAGALLTEAEVGALLERKLEQLREIPHIRRKTPSLLEIEGPDSGADFVRSAAESGCDGGSGMAEVSDFFQRDSRRYDSGFQKY